MSEETRMTHEEMMADPAAAGRQAFHIGIRCAPALDGQFMQALYASKTVNCIPPLNRWVKGWHEANLAAQMEPAS